MNLGLVCFTCLSAFQMRAFENDSFCHIRFIHFEMHASKVLFYQIPFIAHFEQYFEPILKAFVL